MMKNRFNLIIFILFNLLLVTPTNYVDAQKSNFTSKIIYLSGEQDIVIISNIIQVYKEIKIISIKL